MYIATAWFSGDAAKSAVAAHATMRLSPLYTAGITCDADAEVDLDAKFCMAIAVAKSELKRSARCNKCARYPTKTALNACNTKLVMRKTLACNSFSIGSNPPYL